MELLIRYGPTYESRCLNSNSICQITTSNASAISVKSKHKVQTIILLSDLSCNYFVIEELRPCFRNDLNPLSRVSIEETVSLVSNIEIVGVCIYARTYTIICACMKVC